MEEFDVLGKGHCSHSCDTAGPTAEPLVPRAGLQLHQAGVMPQLAGRQRMIFNAGQKICQRRVFRDIRAGEQMLLLQVVYKCRAIFQRFPTRATIVRV